MNLHSFVIRIWQEEVNSPDSIPATSEKWRGHILHYPSQREQYFDDLCNIVPFIQSCTARPPLPRPGEESAGSEPPSGETPEGGAEKSDGND